MEIAALRERLSHLGQASRRITQDLDFNSVLQGALDSARSPAGALVGGNTLSNQSGSQGQPGVTASPITQALPSLAPDEFVTPPYGSAPAHGVELVTAWSLKVGAYSQTTFSSQLLSGFS